MYLWLVDELGLTLFFEWCEVNSYFDVSVIGEWVRINTFNEWTLKLLFWCYLWLVNDCYHVLLSLPLKVWVWGEANRRTCIRLRLFSHLTNLWDSTVQIFCTLFLYSHDCSSFLALAKLLLFWFWMFVQYRSGYSSFIIENILNMRHFQQNFFKYITR